MTGRLKLITGPAAEPVSAADLRDFGRISSDVADGTLTPLIKAARQLAEGYLNRALIDQTWELVMDGFSCRPIALPLPPFSALTSVKVTDIDGATSTMDNSDFIVDLSGGRTTLSLKYGKDWPSVTPERGGVVIRYVAGYGSSAASVPDQMRLAIIMAALQMYDKPGDVSPAGFYALLDPERVEPV